VLEEIIIYGAVNGALYALFAVGLALIFGTGRILNLCHGGFYLIAIYIAYYLMTALNWSVYVSAFSSVIVTFIIGCLFYRLLIKPIRKNELSVIISTYSMAIVFEETIRLTFSAGYIPFPSFLVGEVNIWGVNVSYQRLLTFFVSLTLLFILRAFINKTKIGKAIRAVSQDDEASQLMGINNERIFTLTFGIGVSLAAVAAVLTSSVLVVNPSIGWSPLMIAFSIVVLGGLGSFEGALLGSFIISYAELLIAYGIGSNVRGITGFLIIIFVLIFRPKGLLGRLIE
jgi:branched-chain amino acid transport system permease protein